jgi:hypothetical protein
MNTFKSITMTWWQVSLLKWAVFLIGIAVGATWPELFSRYAVTFVGIGLILSLYLFKVWITSK